jgi:hypothetical protein
MDAVLTVESVRLYLLKMGMRLDDLTDSEQEMSNGHPPVCRRGDRR